MKNKILIIFFLFFSISFKNVFGQNDNRLKGLDNELNKVLKSLKEVGFAVAIVEKDKMIYAKGFGYRDYENKILNDENTLFAIGSCTKAFTSSILGVLRDEGKLNFEDSPIDHVKELRFYNGNLNEIISIRDLMSHRTGIPRHDFSWYFFPTFSKDSLIKRIQYHKPFTTVRNKYWYNNFMFLVQGVIAERITGKSWENNIREKIFQPLGMNRSNLSIEELEKEENAAFGYLNDHEKTDYYKIAGMRPAGSINSSVKEMSKWLVTWINGGKYNGNQILPSSYVLEAMSSHNVSGANLPTKETPDLHLSNYGYGWQISSYKGHYRVEHGGAIDGFRASTAFFPTDSLGIVVLANQGGSLIPAIVRNIISDRMLEEEKTDWLKFVLKQRKAIQKDNKEAKKIFTSSKIEGTNPSLELEEYIGYFNHPGYGTIELLKKEDSLFAVTPYITMWLDHYHYDTFVPVEVIDGKVDTLLSYNDFLIKFSLNNKGEVNSASVKFEVAIEEPIIFKRISKEVNLEKEEMEKYIGEYKLTPQVTTKVYLKDDKLFVFIPGQPEYELLSIGKNKFEIIILEGYKLEFIINDKGMVTDLLFIQPNGNFSAKKK